jgi:hypothetical protein
MEKKLVSKINENTQIRDDCGRWYNVTKIYKTGVRYLDEWENEYGLFRQKKFVTYEELLTDNWTAINIDENDRYNTILGRRKTINVMYF